jgi:hypothetical protein
VVTKSQVNSRVNSVTEKEIVNAIAQSGVAMEEPRRTPINVAAITTNVHVWADTGGWSSRKVHSSFAG